MTQRMLAVMLGLGMIGAVFAGDLAYGQSIGIGVGGGGGHHGGGGYYGGGYYGGGGYHGGGYGGYYGGHYGGSGVQLGLSVPLSSDGSVRLGVGSGGYYSPHYYDRYHYYPHGGYYYGGDNYYQEAPDYYSQPRVDRYAEQTPPEPPPIPTAGQVARFNDDQLAGLLRAACEVFLEDLSEFSNGGGWKKHFKLTEVLELVKKWRTAPLDDAGRKMLEEVLGRVDTAAKNAEYEVITKTWGFKALQAALREIALPPKQRQSHLLSANLQKLTESLDNVTTGAGWKKHLQLDDLKKSLENAAADDSARNQKMENILAKFDAVAKNPQFKVIAELEGFDSTRAALQRYINAPQTDRPTQAPPPPPPAADLPAESAKSF